VTTERKDVAREIEEQLLDRGHMERIPEIFDVDAIVHGPIYTIFLAPCSNFDEIREHIQGNRTGFSDLRHSIHGQLADGDRVITYFTVSGTNDGIFAGMPPTGHVMKGPGISIERFVGDKIVESWQTCDRTLNFTQLGMLQSGLVPERAIADPDLGLKGTIGGPSDPDQLRVNKVAISALYEAFNRDDLKTASDLIVEWADIDMPGPEGSTRREYFDFLGAAKVALDITYTPEALIAEGDLVAALVRMTGTHNGEFFGKAATGNPIDLEIVQTWRLSDGRVTAMYCLPDWFSLAYFLEAFPFKPSRPVEAKEGEHPNVTLLRRAYAAIAQGDIPAAMEIFSPKLVWRVPEGHRLAGVYEGRDTVFSVLGQLVAMTGGSLQMHLDSVFADDGSGVGLVTSNASRNGADFVAKEVHLFEIEDGQVSVFWTLPQVPFPEEYWAGMVFGDNLPR
jgi:predicted ester cyclase